MAHELRRFTVATPCRDGNSVKRQQIDENEFGRRLAEYERLLHAYIFSLVHDWSAAEEILQETYVGLFQKFHKWDPDKDLYAWARAFAHYQVLHYRSRAQRDRLHFDEDFLGKVAATQELLSNESNARMVALERCMEELSETNRRLLDLAYGQDFEIEEVASQAERTVVATYRALSRIRKTLRQCIERKIQSLDRA